MVPLNARRDMAMLGLIHRCVLGAGPEHFRKYFRLAPRSLNPGGRETKNRHSFQLVTYRTGRFLQVVSNSVFGLVDVYNLLPEYVVAAGDVHTFQKRLQELLRLAAPNVPQWDRLFTPRASMYDNSLRRFLGWSPEMVKRNAPVDTATIATFQDGVPQTNATACVSGWLRFASGNT